MYGEIRYIGRSREYTFLYDGKKVRFRGMEDYQSLPLYHCRELIQNGNFLPSENTFKQLRHSYFGNNENPEGMLEGKDCVIIGGGSSLNKFDFNSIKDKFKIAINHSVHYVDSDAVLFIDRKFLKDEERKAYHVLNTYKGMVFAAWRAKYHLEAVKSDKVYYFSLNKHGVQTRYYDGLYSGASSGLCAVNLALMMQAKNIYLLGFDYNDAVVTKHFYNKAGEDKYNNEKSYHKGKCLSISKMYRVFARYNNIINCNPQSRIQYFKFGGIS